MIRNQYKEPSHWHVPVLSLILGLIFGLLIGWVLWPVEWANSWPADLSEAARADYLAAVADAYVASGGSDDGKALAQRRLLTMRENLADEIHTAKLYFINSGQSNIQVSNLEQLATALDAETVAGTVPAEPNVIVPDAIQPVSPTVDTTNGESSFADWMPWLLTVLSVLLVILLARYVISRLLQGREQNSDEPPPQPEPDLYTDNILESVQDQPEISTEDDYDFYEEEIDDDLWREADGYHRSQTAKFMPESEPASAPANYSPYTQRQISHPQTPRRSAVPAITTAVAATTVSQIDDSQIVQQQAIDQTSYTPRMISEERVAYSVEKDIEEGTEEGTEESTEEGTEEDVEDFAEEFDDAMLDKSISELNQSIDDVPIYRQSTQRIDDSSMSQPANYSSGGVESLPSNVKMETPPARQSQPTNTRTVDEARLKSPQATALLGTYTALYHMGEPDYEGSYDIEIAGNHIGVVGMGIDGAGGILDQNPDHVVVFDVWLNDTVSEETLTQLLLSKYAQQHGASDTFRTERPLLPAQVGLHFQLKSKNVLLDCEVTEVDFVENHGPPGLFQSLALKMDIYQNYG